MNFNEDEQKNFETVLGVRRSIVTLAATTGIFCYLGSCIQLLLLIIVLLIECSCTDGWRMCCSGTVVDHVSKKTWILTSATLIRNLTLSLRSMGTTTLRSNSTSVPCFFMLTFYYPAVVKYLLICRNYRSKWFFTINKLFKSS